MKYLSEIYHEKKKKKLHLKFNYKKLQKDYRKAISPNVCIFYIRKDHPKTFPFSEEHVLLMHVPFVFVFNEIRKIKKLLPSSLFFVIYILLQRNSKNL